MTWTIGTQTLRATASLRELKHPSTLGRQRQCSDDERAAARIANARRLDFVVTFGIGNRGLSSCLGALDCEPARQHGRDHLGDHRFKVGQSVNYTSGPRSQAGSSSVYKITQLLPPEGDDRQYRIKSPHEPHERVAKETNLKRVDAASVVFTSCPAGAKVESLLR